MTAPRRSAISRTQEVEFKTGERRSGGEPVRRVPCSALPANQCQRASRAKLRGGCVPLIASVASLVEKSVHDAGSPQVHSVQPRLARAGSGSANVRRRVHVVSRPASGAAQAVLPFAHLTVASSCPVIMSLPSG